MDKKPERIVFVAVDDGYLPQAVEVGARHGGYVEVLRGLEEGERIVTVGSFQLKSKLREELTATDVH